MWRFLERVTLGLGSVTHITLTHTHVWRFSVPFFFQICEVLVRVQQGGHDLDRGHGQACERIELDRRVGAHEAQPRSTVGESETPTPER